MLRFYYCSQIFSSLIRAWVVFRWLFVREFVFPCITWHAPLKIGGNQIDHQVRTPVDCQHHQRYCTQWHQSVAFRPIPHGQQWTTTTVTAASTTTTLKNRSVVHMWAANSLRRRNCIAGCTHRHGKFHETHANTPSRQNCANSAHSQWARRCKSRVHNITRVFLRDWDEISHVLHSTSPHRNTCVTIRQALNHCGASPRKRSTQRGGVCWTTVSARHGQHQAPTLWSRSDIRAQNFAFRVLLFVFLGRNGGSALPCSSGLSLGANKQ